MRKHDTRVSDPTREKPVILVVEGEPGMRRLLRVSLESDGCEMVEAATGAAGIQQAAGCQPEAVLLATDLPDMDGTEVLRWFREWSQAPVLMLSANEQPAAKIRALDDGANDWIAKPFNPGELMARLRSARRWSRYSATARTAVFRAGALTVDLTSRTVKVVDRIVRLTATEYSLLRLFVRHAGKVLTHEHILREVWGPSETNLGYLRVYLTYLRKKLELDPASPRLLLTEPGIGYRLAVEA